MKYLLLMLFVLLTVTGTAQNVKRDSNGNYITVVPSKIPDIKTKWTFTDAKGIIYPVYQTSKGKKYINKISARTNLPYKMYLKE